MSDKASLFPQIFAGVVASIGALCLGILLGWTAPVQDEIQSGKLGFQVTDEEFSWIGSMVPLGSATACIPIGYFINILGRKWTMILLAIPFTFGWCLLTLATRPLTMIISRFILGLSGGGFCVTAPVYTTEIAQSHVRGILGSLYQILLIGGIVYVYVLGAFMKFKWLNISCGICPIVFALLMIFMPESPMYLVSKKKHEAANRNLQWLRGKGYDISREMNEIIAYNEKIMEHKTTMRAAFKRRSTLKALALALSLVFLMQFSGINAITFYQTDIFERANIRWSSEMCTIVVGFVQLPSALLSASINDKIGRRPLLLISLVSDGLSTGMLGLYFILLESGFGAVKGVNWLPVMCVLVFVILFSFGMGSVPWIFAAEVFASDVKGIGVSLAGTFNWSMAFVVSKCFLPLRNVIGTGPTFWVFSVVSLVGSGYIFFCIPETKGKTFAEIQEELEGAK